MFLDLLFKYQCIRTQKKQKVFHWYDVLIVSYSLSITASRFSVPHERLFLDALERDLKREKMGQEPTTVIVGEPATSFKYDASRSLYEQFHLENGDMHRLQPTTQELITQQPNQTPRDADAEMLNSYVESALPMSLLNPMISVERSLDPAGTAHISGRGSTHKRLLSDVERIEDVSYRLTSSYTRRQHL